MFNLKMPNLGPLNKPLRSIRRQLPPLNFITIHYLYFIFTSLLAALILWGSSTPFRSLSFTNALFLAVSAMTEAGLNTVNLSELNTFQQFVLFVLIMLGSAIFVSAFVVHIRWKAFVKKFMDVTEKERRARTRRGRVKTWASNAMKGKSRETLGDEEAGANGVSNEKGDAVSETDKKSTVRDETPPARRGGPEMNGISSVTGERLDDESENLSPISPQLSRTPGITFRDDTRFTPSHPAATGNDTQAPQPIRRQHSGLFSMNGVGARPTVSLRTNTSLSLSSYPSLQRQAPVDKITEAKKDISKYLDTAAGWIARNSQFHGLTEEERDLLGGCEYRAVSLLAWLIPVYFVLWQLIGAIGCGAWVALNTPELASANGLNPWWVGAFNAVSAFNNSGMSLLDANMTAFQRSYYMLITMGLLILAGNTAFPVFLRMIVWFMYKVAQRIARARPLDDPWQERLQTLKFLLDHPRRCYTNLFPSQHTWWLALSLVTLNGLDWVMFEVLNIGNHQLTDGLATRYRVIDGLFQALAVRSGGFYVVVIPTLRISLQVLYVVMMYISAYPIVITMRNSNVYEERSLGIYAEDEEAEKEKEEEEADAKKAQAPPTVPGGILRRARTIRNHLVAGGAAAGTHESNGHFVRQQLRAQLAHDAWWIVLAVFLIMIVEADNFDAKPAVFSVFNFIFEIVSGYGCVGISVGVPWDAYSFCGAWHTLSKLILCAVMLRGRHRGLPVAIDKAVLLPGEYQGKAEEEDGRIRLAKTLTRARLDAGEY